MYHTVFSHSSVEGQLGCLDHSLAIEIKPLWTCVGKFLYECRFPVLLGMHVSVELLGQTGTLGLTFWETAKLFSRWLRRFTFPPAIRWVKPVHVFGHLGGSDFDLSHPTGWKVESQCGFVLHPLLTSDVDPVYVCWLLFVNLLWRNICSDSLSIFFQLSFLVVASEARKRALCPSEILRPYQTWDLQTFSPTLLVVFPLSWWWPWKHGIFSAWDYPNLPISLSLLVCLVSFLGNPLPNPWSWKFTMISSERFVVLVLTRRSMVHSLHSEAATAPKKDCSYHSPAVGRQSVARRTRCIFYRARFVSLS